MATKEEREPNDVLKAVIGKFSTDPLAEQAWISGRTLRNWINGEAKPNPSQWPSFIRIANLRKLNATATDNLLESGGFYPVQFYSNSIDNQLEGTGLNLDKKDTVKQDIKEIQGRSSRIILEQPSEYGSTVIPPDIAEELRKLPSLIKLLIIVLEQLTDSITKFSSTVLNVIHSKPVTVASIGIGIFLVAGITASRQSQGLLSSFPSASATEIPTSIPPNVSESPRINQNQVISGSGNTVLQAGGDLNVQVNPTPSPTLIPTSTPRPFESERDNEVLIIIAQFHRTEGIPDTDIHGEIRREIRQAAGELDFSNLRVEIESTTLLADARSEAEILGNQYNASMIIWGVDTGVRVTINYLNLKDPDFPTVQIRDNDHALFTNPSAYGYFVTEDVPSFMTFLSLFAVGQSFYLEGDYANALTTIESAVGFLDLAPISEEGISDAYFRLGWLYHQENEFKDLTQSLLYYNKSIVFNPNYSASYTNRGIIYGIQGKIQLKLSDFTKAIELDPNDAILYANRGKVYSVQGNYELALVDFTKAIELDPNGLLAYHGRGIAYSVQGNYELALGDFTKAIELDHNDLFAYHGRGAAYSAQGNHELALVDFTKAIELDHNDFFAYHGRGTAYSAQGNYELALADFTKAIELNPNDLTLYNSRAIAYFNQGNYELALADYRETIELDPNFAQAYNNRGNTYSVQGEYELALADFTKAIQIAPNAAVAYYNRGSVYFEQAEYELALADFTKAIQIDPDYAAAYNNRGNTYFAQGEYELALADNTPTIKLDPDYAVVYYNRGNTYFAQGEYELALADFTKAIQIDPNFAAAYDRRARVYFYQTEYKLALADFTKAIQIDPDYAAAYNNRGYAYFAQGEYELALADFTQAIQIYPDSALAYSNRGNVYFEQAEYELALADYRQAMAKDHQLFVTSPDKLSDEFRQHIEQRIIELEAQKVTK